MPDMSPWRILAKVADCVSCHTAGPGHPPFAGGLPMNSPFGVIYSTNITPDPATGIGQYSYADFSRAVREGIARDGSIFIRRCHMPRSQRRRIAIFRIYAYFMNEVKPVSQTPPQTKLPFPFNQRWTLMVLEGGIRKSEMFQAAPDRNAQWNRGAYLVQALGHCGACHTPRGLAYQEKGYSEASRIT